MENNVVAWVTESESSTIKEKLKRDGLSSVFSVCSVANGAGWVAGFTHRILPKSQIDYVGGSSTP